MSLSVLLISGSTVVRLNSDKMTTATTSKFVRCVLGAATGIYWSALLSTPRYCTEQLFWWTRNTASASNDVSRRSINYTSGWWSRTARPLSECCRFYAHGGTVIAQLAAVAEMNGYFALQCFRCGCKDGRPFVAMSMLVKAALSIFDWWRSDQNIRAR